MSKKLWSHDVTRNESESAHFLPEGLFNKSAQDIAQGLKKAVHERFKAEGLDASGEYRSAMSMLDFYINRAGKNLTDLDRKRLEAAKAQLKNLFGKA
ncbi:MAG: DUF3175 domain-containing protein [Candidatus Babeliales bacterium]